MARKKIASDTVNPLQRMFGAYLRLERNHLKLTSKAVADQLKITDTYLRLAESGRAALNQALVFKIIEVFAESSAPTHDSRTISFSRLALFMVGMHWVAAEMSSLAGEASDRRAAEALASNVSDFELFVQRTKEYFDLSENPIEQKEFLENTAAPEVGRFLRSDTYGRIDETAIKEGVLPLRDLLELPTMNIDILLTLKDALTNRPFLHTADLASKWESQHAAQFCAVHGVYTSAKQIVDEENLKCFKYEYLAEHHFKTLQMIFLNTPREPEDLKDEFIKRLNEGRDSGRFLSKDEERKIHFLCPNKTQQKAFGTRLHQLRRRPPGSEAASADNDAYWSFETHSGLHIGFVGNRVDIRNLNLRDSVQNAENFKAIWKELHGSPKN